jgi:hypothetical protein
MMTETKGFIRCIFSKILNNCGFSIDGRRKKRKITPKQAEYFYI